MYVFNLAALFTVLATFTATAAAADQGSYEFDQRYQRYPWKPANGPISEGTQKNVGHQRGGGEYFTSGSPSIVAEDYSAKNAPSKFETWQAQQKERAERKQDRGLNGIKRLE
ncbi:myb-like DNA-binding protein bas1 [Pyricularia grisea]|nr:myb-like DNA-binding protein bas1 [Pyricularia grisea]